MAPAQLDQRLRSLPGVDRVRASAATGNVLVCFDEDRLERARILDALAGAGPPPATGRASERLTTVDAP